MRSKTQRRILRWAEVSNPRRKMRCGIERAWQSARQRVLSSPLSACSVTGLLSVSLGCRIARRGLRETLLPCGGCRTGSPAISPGRAACHERLCPNASSCPATPRSVGFAGRAQAFKQDRVQLVQNPGRRPVARTPLAHHFRAAAYLFGGSVSHGIPECRMNMIHRNASRSEHHGRHTFGFGSSSGGERA